VDLVRSLGADHVVDYDRDDPTDGRQRYELVLDIGGNRPVSRLRRALSARGTLVIVGGEGGGRWLGGMQRQARALVTSPFVRQRLRVFVAREHYEELLVLTELVNTGRLTPVVDRTYPLSEAPEAIRYLEAGHARGKVVISV
jgi:NADPH:quinone reductase-like Zn-dependent oxidoreductase